MSYFPIGNSFFFIPESETVSGLEAAYG